MTWTANQRIRLAKEARKLAYECVEGTAPALTDYTFFERDGKCCALGLLFRRALRLSRNSPDGAVEEAFLSLPEAERKSLTQANDGALDHSRHSYVVFPLLALADALEEA